MTLAALAVEHVVLVEAHRPRRDSEHLGDVGVGAAQHEAIEHGRFLARDPSRPLELLEPERLHRARELRIDGEGGQLGARPVPSKDHHETRAAGCDVRPAQQRARGARHGQAVELLPALALGALRAPIHAA
ncbi:MAG: hypothetical protein U0234_16970 [Sandaracinus sp.]